jgi:uncharacterized glyoxalase superfamily protein PhnB
MAKGVPAGMHTVTPALTLMGAVDAIEFYKQAFGAEEVMRAPDPSGAKVWHAQLRIGDSLIFLNDAFPEHGAEPNRSKLWIYTDDVDAGFARATAAGAKVKMAPADMFWGDRVCALEDGWGNDWMIATKVRELSPEEMQAASEAEQQRWRDAAKK